MGAPKRLSIAHLGGSYLLSHKSISGGGGGEPLEENKYKKVSNGESSPRAMSCPVGFLTNTQDGPSFSQILGYFFSSLNRKFYQTIPFFIIVEAVKKFQGSSPYLVNVNRGSVKSYRRKCVFKQKCDPIWENPP